MKTITIKDLLEYLDGRGLIITDEDLIKEALEALRITENNKIIKEQ